MIPTSFVFFGLPKKILLSRVERGRSCKYPAYKNNNIYSMCVGVSAIGVCDEKRFRKLTVTQVRWKESGADHRGWDGAKKRMCTVWNRLQWAASASNFNYIIVFCLLLVLRFCRARVLPIRKTWQPCTIFTYFSFQFYFTFEFQKNIFSSAPIFSYPDVWFADTFIESH